MFKKVLKDFQPALFTSLKDYNKEKMTADLMAGTIVAFVAALPLAIAFAISSGVTPEKGIITAIIAGFITSLLGGSNVQIGGPAGAFIIIVYGIVEQYGINGLAIVTVLAGIMLLLMGVLKLGSVIKFIPYPIVVGYTSGIALTIFSTQIKDLFGMQIGQVPLDFFAKWQMYFESISAINWIAAGVGLASILIIVVTPRFSKRLPGSLLAIVLLTIVVYVMRYQFGIEGIETIGDRFEFSSQLPKAESISFSLESIRILFPSAFTIAMLAAIETLLSATIADGMIGTRHNSNMELIAQGVANIVVPFFGGIPATGAIARTATNVNSGARTPVAGIWHTVVLLLILLFLGGLTKHIPMAALAGVLVVVSYNMSEMRSFRMLAKQSRGTLAILLATFFLTVVVDITVAIEVGLLLAVFTFINRVSKTTHVTHTKGSVDISKEIESHSGNLKDEILELPDNVEVYEIDGPFFFGVANKFDDLMRELGTKSEIRIIRMRKVPFMDATGLNNLNGLIRNSQKENIHIILSGVTESVREKLHKSTIIELVGEENVCDNIHLAVGRAIEVSATLEKQKETSSKKSNKK